jgi:Cdc6-like AAA superfamily ATPase
LTALFLTDPRDDRDKLIHVKGSRVEGTCEWIKTNELYNTWLHSHSQLLWLSGSPGKGKTMLSIYLAEELEQQVKDSQNALFMQFFCDNRDEKRNTAITIIRGLIWQLLRLRPRLFIHILPSFQDRKETNLIVSFEALWRIFESMVRDPVLGTAYCIIDGLDECDEASLEALLKKFRSLFLMKSNESSACRLNLITVSRDLPDFIPEVLSGFSRLRLDPDADNEVYSDIRLFINDKVDKLSSSKNYPEPLRGTCERGLSRACERHIPLGRDCGQ